MSGLQHNMHRIVIELRIIPISFLAGVSCLFIAAKIEEIYPPKLQEFAFVTDGACSEDEIVQMELVILKGLNWGLSPMTPNRWMKTFMQVTARCYISIQKALC